jgi:uncharacterized protein
VPTKIYDETISTLINAVEKAKLGETDKNEAIKKLTKLAQKAEENFIAEESFESILQKENEDSWKYGGRTLQGFSEMK